MTILAAIDGEQQPSPTVEVGAELARRYDEDLVVIHVMSDEIFDEINEATAKSVSTSFIHRTVVPYDEERITAGGPDHYTIEDAQSQAVGVAREIVAATLDETDAVEYQGRVGDPAEEILNEARRRDARYIVMGPRKRTPVRQAVFGSVTQAVLFEADRPVVTVPRTLG